MFKSVGQKLFNYEHQPLFVGEYLAIKFCQIKTDSLMITYALISIVLPYLSMKIIDNAIKSKDVQLLIKLIIVYLVAIFIQGLSKLLSDYFYSYIGKRIVHDLRFRILRHTQRLSGEYYSNIKAGELIAVFNSDVAAVEELASKMIFSTISDVLVSIGMLIFLAEIQVDLLLITLFFQPIILFIQKKFNKRITNKTNELRNLFGDFTATVQEFFSSMIHFQMLNAKRYFFSRYMPDAKKFMKAGIDLEINFSLTMVFANLISALTTISILGYGGYKVIIGTLTIGGLVAFVQYSQKLLNPIFRIAQLNVQMRQALVSVNRIYKVLDEEVKILHNNRGYKNAEIIGNIEFNNVSFSYNDSNVILNKVNMKFDRGKVTAIVGESGSGKTTVANLILRLWDVNDGEILIDGINIKNYNLSFIRKNISIVSQDVFLFNDSILNNLLLSQSRLRFEDVVKATKMAGIYDFTMTLPEKFDTVIGERGIKLSGGQKQKISIARAILKDAPIVIFDEATSSLDSISEKNIKDSIYSLFENKTVIIIAHRLTTVEDADNIYVLNRGQVMERGRHEELMKLQKFYYNLYMKKDIAV